jgi:hypothetical protein
MQITGEKWLNIERKSTASPQMPLNSGAECLVIHNENF